MLKARAVIVAVRARLRRWCGGIATRSAVVLASLVPVGATSVVLLYQSMCADVDTAARARAVAV